MELNPQVVDTYKQILLNPSKHGFDIKPLSECLENSDTVIAKHLLFNEYVEYINKPLPKVIFYIIMDELYGDRIRKAEDGNLGYALKLNKEPTEQVSDTTPNKD